MVLLISLLITFTSFYQLWHAYQIRYDQQIKNEKLEKIKLRGRVRYLMLYSAVFSFILVAMAIVQKNTGMQCFALIIYFASAAHFSFRFKHLSFTPVINIFCSLILMIEFSHIQF